MPFAARKNKKQNGFTLPEVLVVVALIAVLLTFAAAVFLGYVDRFRLRALDTDAQSIFMAAQDRLTAMFNAGELDQLTGTKPVTVSYAGSETPQPDVTAASIELSYLESTDTTEMAALLPFGAIESKLRAGYFVIEFSKRTGTVYGVWYTDKDSFPYDPADRWPEDFDERLKKSPLVGFYGGSAVDRPTVNTLPTPRVTLLNAEVLRLRVTVPGADPDLLTALGGNPVTVKVGVRKRDAADKNDYLWLNFDKTNYTTPARDAADYAPLTLAADPVTGDVLLDAAYPDEARTTLYDADGKAQFTDDTGALQTATLLGCHQFREWVGFTRLTADVDVYNGADTYKSDRYLRNDDFEALTAKIDPGDDITVAVQLEYSDGSRTYVSEQVFVNTNSLFSAVAEDPDTHERTAQLTYCRHLQNLCYHVNGCYDEPAAPGGYKPFRSGLNVGLDRAELIRDLDFINEAAREEDAARSWMGSYGDERKFNGWSVAAPADENLPHRFESIYCNSVTDLVSFDGHGLSIRNLNTNAKGVPSSTSASGSRNAHTGLFGMIVPSSAAAAERRSVQNVTLVNCRALNGKSVGTLAGVARQVDFTNCRVYLNEMVKNADDTPRDTFVLVGDTTGGEYIAGGLVGRSFSCRYTSCSAATVIEGSTAVKSDGTPSDNAGTGGLIGLGQDDILLYCHAASYLKNGGFVGGLIGKQNTNEDIRACYAAGCIADGIQAAGLVAGGTAPLGTTGQSISYAAVYYGKALVEKAAQSPAAALIYGTSKTDASKALFVTQKGVTYQTTTNPAGETLDYGRQITTEELKKLVGRDDTAATGTGADFSAGGWFVPKDTSGTGADLVYINPTYAVLPYTNVKTVTDPERYPAPPYPYPQLSMAQTGGTLTPPPAAAPDDAVPMVHYGDWLESDSKLPELHLAYIETYVTNADADVGSVSAYALMADKNGDLSTFYDTLLTTGAKAEDDPKDRLYTASSGYCILSPDELDGADLAYTLDSDTTPKTLIDTGETVEISGVTYHRYDFDAPTATVDYYHTLKMGTTSDAKTFLFNPQYACEAIDVTAALKENANLLSDPKFNKPLHQTTPAGATAKKDTVIIRTAAQLAQAGKDTYEHEEARSRAYVQTFNIDYALCNDTIPAASGNTTNPEPRTFLGPDYLSEGKSEEANQTPLWLTGGSYDGGGWAIRGMLPGAIYWGENQNTTDTDKSNILSGLVGYINDGSLTNIRLINTRVQLTSGTTAADTTTTKRQALNDRYRARVGTLAAYIDPGTSGRVTVENCGAFVEPDTGHSTADAAYKAYTVFSRYGTDVTYTHTDFAGGLVGMANGSGGNITFTDCFAAVQVNGQMRAGGFAGNLKNCVVQDCYVGGHTSNGTYYDTDGTPLVNVQAENPNGKNIFAGGFAGELEGSNTFKGVVYATTSVGLTESHDSSQYFLSKFNGRQTGGSSVLSTDTTVYATGALFVGTGVSTAVYPSNRVDDRGDAMLDETTTIESSRGALDAAAYDKLLIDNAAKYPFKAGAHQTKHHGDWAKRLILAYYEVYADGKSDDPDAPTITLDSRTFATAFYATFTNGAGDEQTVNTLRYGDDAIVYSSGYMVISTEKLESISFLLESVYNDAATGGTKTGYGRATLTDDEALDIGADEKLNAMGLLAYPIPYEAVNVAPGNDYYLKATINGGTYLLNPHFACEVVNVDAGKWDADTNRYVFDTTTIRPKKGLHYIEHGGYNQETGKFDDAGTRRENVTVDGIVIRSALQLASMARYTREGNEAGNKSEMQQQTFHLLMNIDAQQYRVGKVFDGSLGNRVEPSRDAWYSGQCDIFGQVGAVLNGGRFEGYGHTISNLYLGHDSGSVTDVGLFSRLEGTATAQNFTLEKAHVNASPSKGVKEDPNDENSKTLPRYYDIGTLVGRLGGSATLQNVALRSTTMEFHNVPDYDKDHSYYDQKETSQALFDSVGGAVGLITGSATLQNIYIDTMSIDLDPGDKYRYNDNFAGSNIPGAGYSSPLTSAGGKGQTSVASTTSDNKDCQPFAVGGIVGRVVGATGAEVTDTVLIDPTVKATAGPDGLAVGGVVGQAEGRVTLSGTGAYLSEANAAHYSDCGVTSTKDNTGVNVGTVQNHYATTSGVGGFAGYLGSGVTVKNSYAALRVTGNSYVGGFAGRISGADVENCYAGGHTTGGRYDTTVGSANVTAASSAGLAGGFAGLLEPGRLNGANYSTCSVQAPADGITGLFAAQLDDEAALEQLANDANLILYATGISLQGTPHAEGAYAKTGALLPAALAADDTPAEPYDATLTGGFPFKTGQDKHHGDWVDAVYYTGVLYWERETDFDGSDASHGYHFHYIAGAADMPLDEGRAPLCAKADGRLVTAGYAVFGPADATLPDLGGSYQANNTAIEGELKALLGSGYQLRLYACRPSDTLTAALPDGTSVSLRLGFADTLGTDQAAVAALGTDAATPLQVRTTGQLASIGGTGTVSGNYYVQTHDILPVPGGTPTLDGAYAPPTLDGGRYDGNGYRVLDLPSGVFAEVKGNAVADGVVLYSPTDAGTITGTGSVGGITARLTGSTLQNCVAAGYRITGTGSGSSVGGLAGAVSGTSHINNSESTVTLTGSTAGGLAGSVTGGSLSVTNSYAGGSVARGTVTAGGLVGSGSSVTYKDVYSYVDMLDLDTAATTVYGIGPGSAEPGSQLNEYWSGGLPASPAAGDDPAITGVSLTDLKAHAKSTYNTPANDVYIPDAGTRGNGLADKVPEEKDDFTHFPFAAFVQSGAGDAARQVHYGTLPNVQTAGFFYHETEGGQLHFYVYGAEIVNGTRLGTLQLLADTLCKDHHLDGKGSAVSAPGYGVYTPGYMAKPELSISNPVTLPDANTDSELHNELAALLSLTADQPLNVYSVDKSLYTYDPIQWSLRLEGFSGRGQALETNVSSAFSAAIGPKAGQDPDEPVYVRTIDQLQYLTAGYNGTAASGKIEYVEFSHDLYGDGFAYTPGVLPITFIDGCGYRILDLDISAENAALFTDLKENDSRLEHLILYATDGKGVITGTNNAAGLVATLSAGTVENCAVAGYTITGGLYVGGIAGQMGDTTKSVINNCEAIVDLAAPAGATGTSAGGIAGYGRGSIRSCYAGNNKDGITGSWTSAGGLYGEGSNSGRNITVADSYSFMKMTGAGAGGTLYAIGQADAAADLAVNGCSFLADPNYLPNTCTTEKQGTEYTTTGEMIEALYSPVAPTQYTFIPSETGTGLTPSTRRYMLKPVVNVPLDAGSDDLYTVHYGDWLRAAAQAGVIYWELANDDSFTYQLVGMDADGTPLDRNTLCTDRHMDEDGVIDAGTRTIKATGYALFNGDTQKLTLSAEALTLYADAGLPGNGMAEKEICSMLGGRPDVFAVYDTTNYVSNITVVEEVTGSKKTYTHTPLTGSITIAQKEGGTPATRTCYYTNGFAGVSTADFGDSADAAYPIRTVWQLDSIPDQISYMDGDTTKWLYPTSGKFFKQAHDLYGDGYSNYAGPSNFGGTYDGDYYHILELDITGSGSSVGLFSTVSGTLKNIILYSPSGTGTITSTEPTKHTVSSSNKAEWSRNPPSVGGLVGATYSSSGARSIENCVVAGYTITGSNAVGGLVGSMYQGGTIKNSVSVNSLVCDDTYDHDFDNGINTHIGGLVGIADSNGDDYFVHIENCYAGGTATSDEQITSVGGILGFDFEGNTSSSGDSTTYTYIRDSYTYLAAKGITATNYYAIGRNLTVDGSPGNTSDNISSGNAYWAGGWDTAVTSTTAFTDQQGLTAGSPGTLPAGTTTVVYSYVPENAAAGAATSGNGLTPQAKDGGANYPFEPVLKGLQKQVVHDGDNETVTYNEVLVHYGMWPDTSTSGSGAPAGELPSMVMGIEGPDFEGSMPPAEGDLTEDDLTEGDPTATPTPDPTLDPNATPTPDPTLDPSAAPTPDPTLDPNATPTPETPTDPEATPEPEATPAPEVTPAPEATPAPEVTPAPEGTPAPEATPAPEPEATPEPTPETPPETPPTEGTPETAPTEAPPSEPVPEPPTV